MPIGTLLFLGEWLFGSLGWGVLHGTEFAVPCSAVGAVLAVLHAGRVARSILLAFIAGVLVAILFGTNAPNQLYSLIADQVGTIADPGPIAFAAGAAIGAAVFGLLGAFAGARNGSAGDAFKGLLGGAIIGALIGVLAGGLARLFADEGSRPMVVGLLIVGTVLALVGLYVGARDPGPRQRDHRPAGRLRARRRARRVLRDHVHVARGGRHRHRRMVSPIALALMAAEVASNGIDVEALKKRFIPQSTIDTTKETIEWAKARISARAGVLAARATLAEELEQLEASTRAAVDIPAKVSAQPRQVRWRWRPARGSCSVGGPRAVFRGAKRVAFGPPSRCRQVDARPRRSTRRSGTSATTARRSAGRSSASSRAYLEQTAPVRKQARPRGGRRSSVDAGPAESSSATASSSSSSCSPPTPARSRRSSTRCRARTRSTDAGADAAREPPAP